MSPIIKNCEDRKSAKRLEVTPSHVRVSFVKPVNLLNPVKLANLVKLVHMMMTKSLFRPKVYRK